MKESVAIVTLAIGTHYLNMWQKFCHSNWQKYADKHGYDLICIDKPLDYSERSQRRSPAWQKCLILSQEFSQKYDRILWIDSDIIINSNLAPSIIDGVPVDKVGAVRCGASLIPEMSKYLNTRIIETTKFQGKQIIESNNNKDYYTSYGLDSEFDDVVQTGVLVLSPTHHYKILEKTYFNYEEIGGSEWNYEMRPLSYELLKANSIYWIDPRFNNCWADHIALHYPFLSINSPSEYSIFVDVSENKLSDIFIPSQTIYSRLCATTAFLNSFFLHFAGCQINMEMVDSEATSWKDCSIERARAAIIKEQAITYEKQGKIDEAIKYYQQAMELYKVINYAQGQAIIMEMMGTLLVDKQIDFEKGLVYLHKSLNIWNLLGLNDANRVKEIIDQAIFLQMLSGLTQDNIYAIMEKIQQEVTD